MTKQEIETGNKLIAKFLGGKIKIAYSINKVNYYYWSGEVAENFRKNIIKIPIGRGILVEHLKFHEDWNWLMIVVEKIESLSHKNFASTEVSIIGNECEVGINIDGYSYKAIVSISENSKIEAVYKACIEFINYYNEQ